MQAANRQRPPAGTLFLDHVSHFVPDLDAAGVALRSLGFAVTPVSAQQTQDGPAGTSNICVMLDDGYLDVVIIKPMSKPGLIRTYPKLFKGTHTTHPQYEHHRVRSVTVAAPGIVSYADGERFGALPLTVECAPGALTVLT